MTHQQAERITIDLALPGRMHAQCLELGAEQQRAARHAVIHRLFAEPVAGQLQGLFLPVPQRQRKHAVAALEGGLQAPAHDRRQQHFRVGMTAPGNAGFGLLQLARSARWL